ncbi:phosphate-starvation-inducible protein PsiE [Paenibacillus turicensis]|uniref:phosphate-starvation-inducible protein PsiE n=1 Tax=Paenibacillus turicensis TaxID=160487 RepID=UPI003D2CB58C
MNKLKKFQSLSFILQNLLNICLLVLAVALSILLISETWYIITSVFKTFPKTESSYDIIAELLVFFLYFELIALIVKYFNSNFHFPLRYFIYIGITAIVRLIIVDHDVAINTFWWSMAILILVCSLFIANSRINRVDNKKEKEKENF